MKNLHLIQTDKPSRLFDDGMQLYLGELEDRKGHPVTNYNIYITNSEEIKEGDWVYCTERKLFGKVIEIQLAKFKSDTSMLYFEINNEEIWCKLFNCKKIILTTDQDLINDGVQVIDDTFLQWFVNNPSCEKVEVESGLFFYADGEDLRYLILIPKEEPISFPFFDKEKADAITKEGQKVIRELQSSMKQELNLNCFDCNKSLQDCTCMEDTIDMKQESIEEAASRLYPAEWDWKEKESFIEGAQWQQEQDKNKFSEEEVLNILYKHTEDMLAGKKITLEQWFEQFKKK